MSHVISSCNGRGHGLRLSRRSLVDLETYGGICNDKTSSKRRRCCRKLSKVVSSYAWTIEWIVGC